jgi:hypothetical protein
MQQKMRPLQEELMNNAELHDKPMPVIKVGVKLKSASQVQKKRIVLEALNMERQTQAGTSHFRPPYRKGI